MEKNYIDCVDFISDSAEKLYNLINEYYMFLVDSISPEDWPIMQEELGYKETYEEHRESLVENVPEAQITKRQIQAFLNKYEEFTKTKYVDLLERLNYKLSVSRDSMKENAFEIIKRNSNGFQEKTKAMETETFSVKIMNTQFDFPTFNNPLMVSLYSIVVTWFSMELSGKPPELISNQSSHLN